MSDTNPRPMYFSQIRIDPTNADRVYLGGVGMHMTIDGGATFVTDAARSTHDDVHAIWIDPGNPAHILIGNDGGLAVSYDMSKTWTFIPNLPVGLFYHVSFDMEMPYNICGGMQDNYNWCGPSASRHSSGIMNYDWFQIQGGDGFVAIPDLRDSRIVYTESQGGNMIRRNKVTGESKSIRPAGDERDERRGGRIVPLQLGHAHDPVAPRPRRAAGGGPARIPIHGPGRLVGGHQPRPHHESRPQRDRDDGGEERRDPDLAQRRDLELGHHRVAGGVAGAGRRLLHGHR